MRRLAWLLLVLVLAGCGGATNPATPASVSTSISVTATSAPVAQVNAASSPSVVTLPTTATPLSATSTATAARQIVTAKEDAVNVRQSAAADAPVVASLDANADAVVLSEDSTGPDGATRWVHVQVGDKQGYVRSDLVSAHRNVAVAAIPPTATAPPLPIPPTATSSPVAAATATATRAPISPATATAIPAPVAAATTTSAAQIARASLSENAMATIPDVLRVTVRSAIETPPLHTATIRLRIENLATKDLVFTACSFLLRTASDGDTTATACDDNAPVNQGSLQVASGGFLDVVLTFPKKPNVDVVWLRFTPVVPAGMMVFLGKS